MSHLPRRQPPALAKVRGELRTYHGCKVCGGTGIFNWHKDDEGWEDACITCGGSGFILVDVVSATKATAQARTARNDAIENHGRQPYD